MAENYKRCECGRYVRRQVNEKKKPYSVSNDYKDRPLTFFFESKAHPDGKCDLCKLGEHWRKD